MELNLCVMGYTDVTDSPFLSWRFCAEYANVDYDEIVKCMSGKDGEAALMEMKNLTAANPHYRGTPSLSLNGVSDCNSRSRSGSVLVNGAEFFDRIRRGGGGGYAGLKIQRRGFFTEQHKLSSQLLFETAIVWVEFKASISETFRLWLDITREWFEVLK